MPVGTLKNRASVARRIDPSRRCDGLTWSHHAEVAGLEPDEADAVLAETALYTWPDTWSVEHLRGVLHQRGATRRAQREVERLQAQLATLQAASTTVDEAKRVVDNVRVEFEAGCRMVEEGYRRMLVAVEREDLAVDSDPLKCSGNNAVSRPFTPRKRRNWPNRCLKAVSRSCNNRPDRTR